MVEGKATIAVSPRSADFDSRPASHTYGLRGLEGTLAVTWTVWTLLGEPVYDCRAALILEGRPSVQGWQATEDLHLATEPVPGLVRNQVRLREAVVDIPLRSGSVRGFLRCDVGAPGQSWGGSVSELRAMEKGEQAEFFSFNSPTSPDWDELVHTAVRLDDTHTHWPAETSRAAAKRRTLRNDGAPRVHELRWDLTPVWEWQASRLEAAIEELEEELKEPESTSEGVEDPSDAFWSTPEVVETIDEEAARMAALERTVAADERNQDERRATDRARADVSRAIAKRRESAARWVPEGWTKVRAKAGDWEGEAFYVTRVANRVDCQLQDSVLGSADEPASSDCIDLICGPGHLRYDVESDSCVACPGTSECVRATCGSPPQEPGGGFHLHGGGTTSRNCDWCNPPQSKIDAYGRAMKTYEGCEARAIPACDKPCR